MSAEQDEVDRILATWHAVRPGTDVSPLAVLSRVSRLASHLETARTEAFRHADLTGWGFDLLAALRRNDGTSSPGALGAATLASSSTLTHRLGALEKQGLLTRGPDPTDGRGVTVALTAAGRRVVDQALDELVAAEQWLLAPLSPADRTTVAALLRTVLMAVEN